MLSYVYQVASQFEAENGFSPNLIYMNYTHLECLKQEMDDPRDFDSMVQLLGMEIIVHQDVIQPLVSWADAPWKHAISV